VAREQRKLAAIIAADVVGYSRLMGRDESGTLARLRKNRSDHLNPVVAKYGGRLVKLTGDGALIEFGSAVDALSAAIEFQQAMADANRDQPDDSALVFRMGLHLGDLIVEGDDLYGDGVNIAARLEVEAPTGGIVISRTVHEAVAGRMKATFDDLGALALKNIERPVQAFGVRWESSDWQLPATFEAIVAPLKAPPGSLPLPDRPSIAVLPFQNMSGDAEQEYFSDGMVEDIITALSRFKSLFVIARNSSFTYKGKAVDVRQVGRELGVRYVLEGSVRKAADRIRIVGQLIDAQSGAHLWADKFEGSFAGVFDLQDQVATKVVSAIAPKLRQSDIERARRKPTEKMDSYDCLLRGMAASMDRSKWPTSEAQDWFRRAIELDPEHAAALAYLAQTIQIKAIAKGVPLTPAEWAEAIELSERACKLAQDDGSVLGRAAQVICYTGRQYDRASSLMEDAVKLNPNDAGTWNHRGWVALMCHDAERAVQSFQQSLVLDPLTPNRGTIWNGIAFASFALGKYDEGREFAEKSVELVADVHSLPALIVNEVRSGRLGDARQRAAQLMKIHPGFRASHSHHLFPVRSPEFHQLLADALREAGISE
jgi:TolB-like protein/class 3 adenylate cyclase/tetratricopeptide (TPR) repeat protein